MRKILSIKKWASTCLALALCACLAFTSIPMQAQAAKKTQVASPLKKSDYTYKVKKNNILLPDPAYYSKYALISDDTPEGNTNCHSLKFTGGKGSAAIFEEYVQLLQDKFLLKQVDYKDWSDRNGLHFSYGFDYTGTADAVKGTETLYNEVPCHVSIWGDKSGTTVKFYLYYSKPFILGDTGDRTGGKTVSRVPVGKSALAGLYQLSDGSYQTSDKRLKTKLGYATVLRDGKKSSVKATWTLSNGDSDQLWIENYYRNECIFFEVPENYLMKGDLFQLADLERSGWVVGTSLKKSDFTGYRWGRAFFGLGHGNNTYVTPLRSINSEFSSLTVRLMHYERNEVAVFYVYAKCKTAPYEIEALCAVKPKGATAKNTITVKTGATKSISFKGQVFGAGYEVYKWEILSGKSYISLSSKTSSTCKVKGKKKGTAKIRVTYDYDLQEPDVLTGIIRSQPHSATETFTIKVK